MSFKVANVYVQKRYLIAFLAFFGYVNMYCLRTNLSMALVEMTSIKTVLLKNGTYVDKAEFQWSSHEKSLILSAFSFGYIFTILGGMTATKYGGATVFGVGIGATGAITLLTPYLIKWNFAWFLVSRALEGLFEAGSFSSMSELWSRWAPPEERCRLVSFSFTGVYVGLTVSYPVAGFIASAWGWPAIFYTTGISAVIWSLIWMAIVKNDPSEDKSLSKSEREFLANRLKNKEKEKITYPWKEIFTSVPVWTLCIVEFVFSCGYTIIILYLPLYIKDINNININSIGILSALPHFCAVVSHPIAGYLADVFRNKNILSATQIHKIYICVGFSVGAALLNVAAFWHNFIGIMVALSIFRLFTSFSDVAFHVNVIDLSSKYASLLFGISTTFFTLGSVASPFFIGQVVQTHSQFEWNICFFSFGVIYIFGALLYLYFSSGERQPWDDFSDKLDNEKPSTND